MCIAAGEARRKLLQPEFPLARLHAPFPFFSLSRSTRSILRFMAMFTQNL